MWPVPSNSSFEIYRVTIQLATWVSGRILGWFCRFPGRSPLRVSGPRPVPPTQFRIPLLALEARRSGAWLTVQLGEGLWHHSEAGPAAAR